MTLQEWSDRFVWVPQDYHGDGVLMVVPIGPGETGYRDLFHLTDYRVTTVGSGVCWLHLK